MTQVAIYILVSSLIYLIIGVSFNMTFRVRKFIDIGHAIFLSIGAYFTFQFSISLNFSLIAAIPASILAAVSLMLLINQLIYKPLQKRNVEGWQMLVISIGAYLVAQNIISIIWGDNILSFRTWQIKKGNPLFGAYINDVQVITVIAILVLLFLNWFFLEKTIMGRKIKAVYSNTELSEILGISKEKSTLTSLIIGTSLATCAGILIAADTDMTPTMGFNWLLYAVVAMIIGGMGKMRFLLLGSLLLATAQHLSAYYFDSKWMNATAYVILILFLAWKPYGFSGQKLKKVEV